MADELGTHPHFRLDFEQQRKRAKDLLRAARAGDAEELARFKFSPPRLAEAQYLIAREMHFDDWAHLKRHISAMARERQLLDGMSIADVSADAPALDGELRTLHVRCGSDIRPTLLAAGFRGDFYEHSYPYLIGPVREGQGSLEERDARACDTGTARARARHLARACRLRSARARSHHADRHAGAAVARRGPASASTRAPLDRERAVLH